MQIKHMKMNNIKYCSILHCFTSKKLKKCIDGNLYCNYHYGQLQFQNIQQQKHIAKYDLTNRNGSKLCHGFGCRKHTKLTKCFNGLFCKGCKEKITNIRANKNKEKSISEEIIWRFSEYCIRKIEDYRHIKRIYNLLDIKNKEIEKETHMDNDMKIKIQN